jgi:hypothetical protein
MALAGALSSLAGREGTADILARFGAAAYCPRGRETASKNASAITS